MAAQSESLTLTREQKKKIESLFNFNSKWATMTQGESSSNTFVSSCVTIIKMLEILGVSDVETFSDEIDGVICERITLN